MPLIPRVAGSFHSKLVANPDILEFKGRYFLYFRGQDEGGHDQIGVLTRLATEADGLNWDFQDYRVVIPVSSDPRFHDSNHVLDPAAIEIDDSVFLYYTAKPQQDPNDYSIALAVSSDGTNFQKHPNNPLISRAIAPEVITFNGMTYLFFHRHNTENDHWEVFVRTSENGVDFPEESERRIFGPSRIPGEIDSKSIATIRLFKDGEFFYMTFAACQKFLDYPESIGLARSRNLYDWDRYPSNPIFTRGNAGEWDEGAIWFATVHKIANQYVMWYEGAGCGLGLGTKEAIDESLIAREEDYGGYLKSSFSQVGIALYEGDFPKW